jgi:hypothetical protein
MKTMMMKLRTMQQGAAKRLTLAGTALAALVPSIPIVLVSAFALNPAGLIPATAPVKQNPRSGGKPSADRSMGGYHAPPRSGSR